MCLCVRVSLGFQKMAQDTCNRNHNYVGAANTTLFLYSRTLSNFNIAFVLRENPVTSLYLNGQVNKFPLDLNAT